MEIGAPGVTKMGTQNTGKFESCWIKIARNMGEGAQFSKNAENLDLSLSRPRFVPSGLFHEAGRPPSQVFAELLQ